MTKRTLTPIPLKQKRAQDLRYLHVCNGFHLGLALGLLLELFHQLFNVGADLSKVHVHVLKHSTELHRHNNKTRNATLR